MDTDLWARIERLFALALERPPDARSSFLEEVCGDDADLRRRVQSLVDHHQTAAGQTPGGWRPSATETRADEPSEVAPDRRIGPYRILRQLGHGGMGEVWLAEQTEPIQRRVALKVIKRGMDTRQVVARFEAERQALAMMDHPCVASVYDAGATAGGHPYFVMQYVQGVPITEYCDAHRLGMSERLALFEHACDGVQHAHQKTIIHRDLKPSNILVESVDGHGMPRIIDFGIAKATAVRLTEKTLFTEQGVLIGTPEYMSPEQADSTGEDVDTRTDVYALGVILYEMLTGMLPFDPRDLRAAGFDGIRRRIREEEPPKPSTRVSSLDVTASSESAKRRNTDPGSLRRLLRGDLDWIVMKALEKDRMRRYDSPRELAADLKRYLRKEPVSAGPPGAAYRAGKFVRRHAVAVAATAAVVVALLAGAIGVGVMAWVANRERADAVAARDESERAHLAADHEASKAKAVTDFITTTLWRANPRSGARADITMREALDIASDKLETNPPPEPETEAAVRHTVGMAYRELGLYDRSEGHFRKVIAIQERLGGSKAHGTVRARHKLASLMMARGQDPIAEPMLREAVADYRALLPGTGGDGKSAIESDLADALNDLGTILTNTGKVREAISLFEELGELDKRIHGETSDNYAIGLYNLAILHDNIGEYEDEERLISRSFGIFTKNHPEERAEHAYYLDTLGVLALKIRDTATADRYNRRALDIRRRFLGDQHSLTAFSLANVAEGLQLEGRYDEARTMFVQAIGIQARAQGERSRKVAYELHRLARLEQEMGRLPEAERDYMKAIDILTGDDGVVHPHAAEYVHDLGTVQEARHRLPDAERSYREALRIQRASLPEGNPGINESLMSLGRLLMRTGRLTEAEPLFLECRDAENGRPPSAYRPPSGAGEAWLEARRAQVMN